MNPNSQCLDENDVEMTLEIALGLSIRFKYKLCFVIDKDILPLLPKFIASIGYHFFIHGAPLRALRARESSAI